MRDFPHIVAIPLPAQGHVIPLMELCLLLAKHGFKVTFVNSEFNHNRVIKSLSNNQDLQNFNISLVSIPDGLEPEDDRANLKTVLQAANKVMPEKLEELIRKMNESEKNEISCFIGDLGLGWPLKTAEKMGIRRRIAFWPASATALALTLSIPKLIEDGITDTTGAILKEESLQLSPVMPIINSTDLWWTCHHDVTLNSELFQSFTQNAELLKSVDWAICNSSKEMEPGAFTMFPQLTPIGPLLASNRLGTTTGHFWPEDSDCLTWLDQHPRNSVIYVAFGSLAILNRTQFQELALGLELSNRPFLWVVRQDFIETRVNTTGINTGESRMIEDMDTPYPQGFKVRVANRGRLVRWAPQQKVLAHPSVGCFLSHCGWNSTVEGLTNGVPFLCWPYFSEQFLNQSYICDVWKVGLSLHRNECGIIEKEQIKSKVDELFEDGFKARVVDLQAQLISSVKQSNKNICDLVAWMKTNEQ